MPPAEPAQVDAADWSRLRGRFLVLDGGEGCGKSTQARRLGEFLTHQGLTVHAVRDPGSTILGEKIRDLLLDPANDTMAMRCEMLLYMAARAQLVKETVAPALDAGEVVLSDRFISSTLAYQLGGDGLSVEDIERVAEVAVGGHWPDLTIVLDVPTEVAMARHVPKLVLFEGGDEAEKDRIERRPTNYHRRVRQNYLDQAQRHPERYAVVDASQDVDAAFTDVLRAAGRLTR